MSCLAQGSFTEVVSEMLSGDPEYQRIQNQREYQNTLYKAAISEFVLPSVNLTLSKVEEKEELGGNSFNYEQGGLNFSLSLFSFGADYANLKASKHALKSYKNLITENLIAREEVLIDKLLTYIARKNVVEIQEEILQLKLRLFQISKRRFNNGGFSRDDLTRVEIDYLNAKTEALIAEQSLLEIENELDAFGSTKYKSLSHFPWNKKFNKNNIQKVLTFETNLASHPSVQRLQNSLDSKLDLITKEKRAHFGQISLGFSQTYNNSEITEEQFGQRTSLNLVIPIFEKFSQQKNLELARAEALTAKSYLDFTKRELNSSQKTLKSRFKLSFKNYQIRKDTLSGAKRIFNSSTNQFRKGRISTNDLLIEQDRYLSTKLLTNRAIYTMHLEYMKLIHFYGFPLTEKREI